MRYSVTNVNKFLQIQVVKLWLLSSDLIALFDHNGDV